MESSSTSPPPAKRVKLDQDLPTLIGCTNNTASTMTAVAGQLQPYNGPFSIALELKVGIKEYINPSLAGFTGILKQRYTDFLVHEITPEGEVLHLRCLNAPGWKEEGWDKVGVDEKRLNKAGSGEAEGVEQKNWEENSKNATVVKDFATVAQLSSPTDRKSVV